MEIHAPEGHVQSLRDIAVHLGIQQARLLGRAYDSAHSGKAEPSTPKAAGQQEPERPKGKEE